MSEQNTIRRLGKMNHTINELAASFAEREGVEALVLAGSAATGLADEESDYDLYAYTREAVPIEFRANLLKPRAARLEFHNSVEKMVKCAFASRRLQRTSEAFNRSNCSSLIRKAPVCSVLVP
jgi:predicted nucleotidyltransferase